MQRQRDVLQARQRRQQVEELEDESDLVAPHARQLVVAEFRKRLPVQLDLALSRPVQPADQVQQGRFPGARRPHDATPSRPWRSKDRSLRAPSPCAFPQMSWKRPAGGSLPSMMTPCMNRRYNRELMRIGVDAGGTFTDFVVLHDDGRLETFKLRSNPRSPAKVILAGLEQAAANAAKGRRGPRFHRRHQCVARAQRRADGLRHHRRIRGSSRNRPPEPSRAVQPHADAAPAFDPARSVLRRP